MIVPNVPTSQSMDSGKVFVEMSVLELLNISGKESVVDSGAAEDAPVPSIDFEHTAFERSVFYIPVSCTGASIR